MKRGALEQTAMAFGLSSLLLGCGRAASTVSSSVSEDHWMTLSPTTIEARAGKLDGGDLQLAIDGKVVAAGPMKVGTVLPITLEGHRCEAREASWFETDDVLLREEPKNRQTKRGPEVRYRKRRGINLELECADAPVPGTEAASRGAHPKQSFPPTMGGLVVGFGVGAWFEKDRIGLGLLTLLAGLAAGALVFHFFDGLFSFTLAAAYVGYGVIGAAAGTAALRASSVVLPVACIGAGIVAAIPVLIAYSPAWSIGGPLVAFAASLVAAVIAAVLWAVAQPDSKSR